MKLPCDLVFGWLPEEYLAGDESDTDLRRKIVDIHQELRSQIQIAIDEGLL